MTAIETETSTELTAEALFKRFAESEMLEEFAEAFEEATNLPLKLEDATHANRLHLTEAANKVCQVLEDSELTKTTCSACHARMHKLAEAEPVTTNCYYGLQVHLTPVKYNGTTFSYLATSLLNKEVPPDEQCTNIENLLDKLGADLTTLTSTCNALETQAKIPVANNPNKVFAWLDAFAAIASDSAPDFANHFDNTDD